MPCSSRLPALALLLLILGFLACSSGGGNGIVPAYNFNGEWQTGELVSTRRSGNCETLLKQIPITFPAFNYSVEQVGENITLRDSTGELTGRDQSDSFSVTDESELPGEIVDPAVLEPPFSSPNFVCTVVTTIEYQGESELSGMITVRFQFDCTDLNTGEIAASCTLDYGGVSDKVSP
ncbi:MAG: hypothetical protein KDD69_13820 [Bdellovibrionales bacterium]|nr:hypothetical protein [Bdellovibrionales bacterium]